MKIPMTTNKKERLPIRGFLLHITHYDPVWCQAKDEEEPFNLDIGLEIIDCMADVGFNLLVLDCADGLVYQSHPELKRHYSQPMSTLKSLVQRANQHDIEVVPLLNFAQSGVFQNNHWFRPHNKLFDSPQYWQFAFDLIDELRDIIRPLRFFHIGMDEDHWRSHRQYLNAIQTLGAGLKDRQLRPLIWNASALSKPEFEVFKEKSIMAEKAISKDIVQILFDYSAVQAKIFRRILDEGFELWGAPGLDPVQIEEMRDLLLRYGGQGILLTRWIPCMPANREQLLNHVRRAGAICCQPADRYR